jgi:hypothetical protein
MTSTMAQYGAVVLAPSGLYRVIGHASSSEGKLYRLEPLEGQPSVIMCEAWRCRVIPRPLASYPPVKP